MRSSARYPPEEDIVELFAATDEGIALGKPVLSIDTVCVPLAATATERSIVDIGRPSIRKEARAWTKRLLETFYTTPYRK